jgi:hypothetical protein
VLAIRTLHFVGLVWGDLESPCTPAEITTEIQMLIMAVILATRRIVVFAILTLHGVGHG